MHFLPQLPRPSYRDIRKADLVLRFQDRSFYSRPRVSQTKFFKLASGDQGMSGREAGNPPGLGTACFLLFRVTGGRCRARLPPFQLLFFKKDKGEKQNNQTPVAQAQVCTVGGLHELPLSNHKKASVEPARGPGTAFPSKALLLR